MTAPVKTFGTWKTNAELILAVRGLGYLDDDNAVWDATHNKGAFWNLWRPRWLAGTDMNRKYTDPAFGPVDFTRTGWPDRYCHHVVFDPPYRLNGTPDRDYDGDFGISERASWQERMSLIERGTKECARVLGGGYLLVKVQDQVCSGQKRWQTDLVTETAAAAGLRKVDRLDMPSYRGQPAGRSQRHAHTNTSTLLVFNKPKPPRKKDQS